MKTQTRQKIAAIQPEALTGKKVFIKDRKNIW
jgi:hypothetical protein